MIGSTFDNARFSVDTTPLMLVMNPTCFYEIIHFLILKLITLQYNGEYLHYRQGQVELKDQGDLS